MNNGPKERVCKLSGKTWKQYNSLQKCPCEECRKANPPKPLVSKAKPNLQLKKFYVIPQVSKKRKVESLQYAVLRTEFLSKKENKVCPITGGPTTDVHHKKGRIGSLLLDTNYWLAVSREGHKQIEENPVWAKEMGYSLSRLEK